MSLKKLKLTPKDTVSSQNTLLNYLKIDIEQLKSNSEIKICENNDGQNNNKRKCEENFNAYDETTTNEFVNAEEDHVLNNGFTNLNLTEKMELNDVKNDQEQDKLEKENDKEDGFADQKELKQKASMIKVIEPGVLTCTLFLATTGRFLGVFVYAQFPTLFNRLFML